MRTIIKIQKIIIALAIPFFLSSGIALAAPVGCDNSNCSSTPPSPSASSSPCDKVVTNTDLTNCLKHDKLDQDINTIINFLSAGVGIAVVGSMIMGGIQYTTAGNNPSAVSSAKQRIASSLVALFVFFFVYAFLQWIIPGGVLYTG